MSVKRLVKLVERYQSVGKTEGKFPVADVEKLLIEQERLMLRLVAEHDKVRELEQQLEGAADLVRLKADNDNLRAFLQEMNAQFTLMGTRLNMASLSGTSLTRHDDFATVPRE